MPLTSSTRFRYERELEDALEADLSPLGRDLLIIRRQVHLTGRKRMRVDLLAIDADGAIWVIELKIHDSKVGVLTQALKYAFWVQEQGIKWVEEYYERNHRSTLAIVFARRFGRSLVDAVGCRLRVKLLIVAAGLDAVTADAINELQSYDFPIEAATFAYDDATRSYDFRDHALPCEHGTRRHLGSASLRSDLERIRAATWARADAVHQTCGPSAQGGFAHRTPSKIADLDPLIVLSWAKVTTRFHGRALPTSLVFEVYKREYEKASRYRLHAKAMNLLAFGRHLRMVAEGSGGWTYVEALAPSALEVDVSQLTEICPAWTAARPEKGSGYTRSRAF